MSPLHSNLQDADFLLYCSGVYEGRILFTPGGIVHARVDLRQRTQLKEDSWRSDFPTTLPLEDIARDFEFYATGEWASLTEAVELGNGLRYSRHLNYQGTVAGEERTSQLWAMRGDTALDVVTVEGTLIAFVCPNRYGMDILVKSGYEALTPLTVYSTPGLSEPRYGVNDLGTVMVAMRDGTKLATDVYLPEGPASGSKFPTILVRTCYDRTGRKGFLQRFVKRGYAVVNQDVRGRADSDGELVPFYYERDDGSDTIDWIAAQNWSDGSVGMWGASYLGYVVVAAATSGNPRLKAVVDEVNVGSPFVDTVRRGGTLCSWPLLSWTLAQSVGPRTDFNIFGGLSIDVEQAVDARPIKDIPQQMIHRRSGPWDIWSEHPEYDEFWRNCTLTEREHQVNVPMFVISGWFDGDSPGVSETWGMLTRNNVPHRKIWLGPWEHNPNRARDYYGRHFSNDAVVYNYDLQVLRWFDRFLKGIANGIDEEPRAEYYVMGSNVWRTSDNWTPTDTTVTDVYLTSGGNANSSYGNGRLTFAEPVEERQDAFIYNPEQPFTDTGEREPENLRQQELRSDILVYTSDPLTRSVTVAGELSCEIFAASTGRDTDWVVTLTDVEPSGASVRLSNYMIRAKYRNGADSPELLVPGKVERYEIFLQNLAHTFSPGHRIRFTITSSSKFVAFPNSNTGNNPYDDTETLVVVQTVYHGPEHPSRLRLPLLSAQ